MPGSPSGRGRLLATGFFTFVLVGATQALYGPSFAAFQERFSVTASVVGLIVSSHFLGSFLAIASSGLLLARFGYRRLLPAGALLMAAGAAGVALSGSWSLALAAAFAIGAGFGWLDVAVNLLFARTFERRAAPALNLLNAMFGLGAILGPALVALLLPNTAIPYLAAAAASLLAAPLLARLPEPSVPSGTGPAMGAAWGRVAGFVAVYFLYVAGEVAGSAWEATHLAPRYGVETAAAYTSLYWAAITAGRFLATPLSARVAPAALVLGATALGLLAALLTFSLALAPLAYALLGLAFAPIFPTTLAWLQQVFPLRAEQVGAVAVAAANLGPVTTAPLIGLAVAQFGVAAVPGSMTLLVGALLLACGLLYRATAPGRRGLSG